MAREWHTKQFDQWTENHAGYVLRRFEADAFPKPGARPIAEIQPPEILEVLQAVERRGAREIAHRLSQSIGAVFRYAIGGGRATSDPTRDLRGQLKPVNHERYAALTAKELPEFLRRLESNDARLYLQTRLAPKLLVLTFVRTGELVGARWSEIDLDGAEWRIPPERMKMREGHIVPLSRQAMATLLKMRTLNRDRDLVFPNQARPDGPMSNNTMLFALARMGYKGKATGHGFRATASTILNEHGFNSDWIERQLAHGERNKVRRLQPRAASAGTPENDAALGRLSRWNRGRRECQRGPAARRGGVVKSPPGWAREVVVDLDPEFVGSDTVDRLLNVRRAWAALPSDKARRAVLWNVVWVNAFFGRDPRKYPAPDQIKANVKLAARHLRVAATTLAGIPDGTIWHLGVPSNLATILQTQANRVFYRASDVSRYSAQSRPLEKPGTRQRKCATVC